MMKKRSSVRLEYLDSLRGLAALSVVVCHYIQNYGMPRAMVGLSSTPLRALYDGKAAVQLFFVLSGFVLALPHFRATAMPEIGGFRIGRYLVARTARIWLPYVAVLAFSILCRFAVLGSISSHSLPPGSLIGWWLPPVTFSSILHQIVLFHASSPGDPRFALVPQAWSLANEMFCSCLIPVAVLLAARGTFWLVLSAGVAIVSAGLSPVVGTFCLGVLIAKYFGRVESQYAVRVEARAVLVCISVLLYTSWPWTHSMGWSPDRQDLLMSVGAGGIIISLLLSPSAQKLLSGRALTHVGRISYSVYLVHVAVLIAITPFVQRRLDAILGAGIAWWMGLAVTVTIVLLVSYPMYKLIELRSVQIGKLLADGMDRLTGVASRRLSEERIPALQPNDAGNMRQLGTPV